MPRTRTGAALAGLLVGATLAGLGSRAPSAFTAQKKGKGGKDAFEGTWTAVAQTLGSTRRRPARAKLFRLTFHGEKVTQTLLHLDGEKLFNEEATFKTDASKHPKQFDMQLEKDIPELGIYKLEKDRLTLCLSRSGKRPTKFESAEDPRATLLVLQRGELKLSADEESELRSEQNLKLLGLAMHSYHDKHKHLPAPAVLSKAGKPLLSWRVTLLPYLGEEGLYQQFKRDEPWDSAHNKKLLGKMPRVYAPMRGQGAEPHSTFYQVFVGPGTAFESGKKLRIPGDIPDGVASTIFVVEAGEAVPWTKPADLPYDPKKPLPRLGGLFPDGFYIALLVGTARWVGRNFDERIFRLAITRNDGQKIDLDKLNK